MCPAKQNGVPPPSRRATTLARPGANSCSRPANPAASSGRPSRSAQGRSGLTGFTVSMRTSSRVSSTAFINSPSMLRAPPSARRRGDPGSSSNATGSALRPSPGGPRLLLQCYGLRPPPVAGGTPAPPPMLRAPPSARRRGDPGSSCPEIGGAHLVVLDQIGRSALRHQPALGEYVPSLRDGQCLVDVLLHQEHRHALLVDAPDGGEVLLQQQGREAQRRLVDEQQGRSAHQPAADGKHGLLATGKCPRQLLPPLGE